MRLQSGFLIITILCCFNNVVSQDNLTFPDSSNDNIVSTNANRVANVSGRRRNNANKAAHVQTRQSSSSNTQGKSNSQLNSNQRLNPLVPIQQSFNEQTRPDLFQPQYEHVDAYDEPTQSEAQRPNVARPGIVETPKQDNRNSQSNSNQLLNPLVPTQQHFRPQYDSIDAYDNTPLLGAHQPNVARPATIEPPKQKQDFGQTPAHLRFIPKFAWKLFRESRLEGRETNSIICPISVHVLLAILADVSEGDTKEQFLQVIGSPDSKLIGKATNAMKFVRSRNELEIGSAIFPSRNYALNDTFRDNARISYIQITPVDYTNPSEAANIINSWAAQATKNQIQNIATNPNPSAKLLLANAVFFRGFWKHPFNVTMEDTFYNSDSQQKIVTFMKQTKLLRYGKAGLRNGIQYHWVELPYEHEEFSMIIVLPLQPLNLSNLIEGMGAEDFAELLNSVDTTYKKNVHLKIPKFGLKSKASIKNILQSLGLINAFDENAHIPYLAKNEFVRVDDAVQHALLNVDEKGSVASAATVFSVITLSSGIVTTEEVDFVVNRPFLSIIVDKRQTLPLFISKIFNP